MCARTIGESGVGVGVGVGGGGTDVIRPTSGQMQVPPPPLFCVVVVVIFSGGVGVWGWRAYLNIDVYRLLGR